MPGISRLLHGVRQGRTLPGRHHAQCTDRHRAGARAAGARDGHHRGNAGARGPAGAAVRRPGVRAMRGGEGDDPLIALGLQTERDQGNPIDN